MLTPNNADYTTGNVIARRRRVRFGEGPSGNRIVMHAAARGLRRPGVNIVDGQRVGAPPFEADVTRSR